MTCIVATVFGGEVFMAGDLMGSNGFVKKVYPDPKVFKNGDFVVGYTSSFRMGQLLQYNWKQPPRIEGLTDRQYLQVDVIESMRGVFNAYGYGSNEGLEDIGGNFLIGYKGSLYEMQPNFSILKHEDFAAIGSGQDYANSVLSVLEVTIKSPEDVVECLGTAIKTAARFTTSVSEEFTWESNYIPTESELEDAMWEENDRMVDEGLAKLSISQKDKDTFNRVKDMLDKEMTEDGNSGTECCGDTSVKATEVSHNQIPFPDVQTYDWVNDIRIESHNYPEEPLVIYDVVTGIELGLTVVMLSDYREEVLKVLEEVTGELPSRKKSTKTLSLELIALATKFVIESEK